MADNNQTVTILRNPQRYCKRKFIIVELGCNRKDIFARLKKNLFIQFYIIPGRVIPITCNPEIYLC
jgi:hypothetical protein